MTIQKTLLLFCFAFFLVLVAGTKPAFAAPASTFINSQIGTGVIGTLTGCSTAGAKLIVVTIINSNGTNVSGATLTSSSTVAGNWTWTNATGTSYSMKMGYVYAPSISDSEAINVLGGAYYDTVKAACFPAATPPYLDKSSNVFCGGPTTSCPAGSITPTQSGELIISSVYNQASVVESLSGFALVGNSTDTPAMAWQTQATATTTNPTWTTGGGTYPEEAAVMSFYQTGAPVDYSVSGATSGYNGLPSSTITLTKTTGNWSGQTVIWADGGLGGTVTPASGCGATGQTPATLTLNNGANTCTFTYTPPTTGTITFTFTGSGMNGSNPVPYTFTSNASGLTMSCASGSGSLGSASGVCTVTLNGFTFNNSYAVTVADFISGTGNGGTFNLGGAASGSGVSSVTAIPTSGATFTFTYTPAHVGAISFVVSNPNGWLNPSNIVYTVTPVQANTCTAAKSGNWNDSTVWSCSGSHTTPTSGDSVIITGYNVICSTGTCYVGNAPGNNTTYDLTIAPNSSATGTLEVASGATLWLTGNYHLNNTSQGHTHFAVLKVDTGGKFIHDNNNNASVAYRGYGGTAGNFSKILFGSSTDTCTLSAPGGVKTYVCPTNYIGANFSGAEGGPVLFDNNAVYDVIQQQVYGTALVNCGNSSFGCANAISNNTGAGGSVIVDFENDVFASSSPFQGSQTAAAGVGIGPSGSFVWKNNREINDVVGTLTNDYFGSALFQAGTCIINNNYFDALAFNSSDYNTGCQVTYNTFSKGESLGQSSSHPWGSFANNFFIETGANDANTYVPIANNIMYDDCPGCSSSLHLGFNRGQGGNFVEIGNIGDNNDSYITESHCGSAAGGLATSAYNAISLDNLAVMTAAGASACSWWGYASSNSSETPLYMDHDGSNGQSGQAWLALDGHGSTIYPSNAVWKTMRANIGWAPTTAGTLNYMIADLQQATNPPTPTTLADGSTVVDWNDAYNASANTLFGPGSPQNGCKPSTFNGTPYQICAASGGPGPHEKTVNPNYIDSSRHVDTWASRVMGQAQSINGARAAMWGCASMTNCITNMYTWIRQGYQPTNMALKGVAPDGYIIGVNGNLGTGYTPGTCTATITIVDATDLASSTPGSLGCTINSSTTPVITVTNPGAHYLISNPATVLIDDGHGHTSTGLTVKLNPMDIGPVPIYNFASVAQ